MKRAYRKQQGGGFWGPKKTTAKEMSGRMRRLKGRGWKSDVNKYLKGTKGISRAAALSKNKYINSAGKVANMFGYGWKSDVNKYLKGTKGISRAAGLSTNKGIRTAGKIAGMFGYGRRRRQVIPKYA